jgi:UDP-N-acetylmuramoyl-tripeptide--D-alanyl-D-alanine ligase
MLWTLSAVTSATRGRLIRPPAVEPEPWVSVSTDSRQLEPGSLFVPIKAQRDGHQFVEAALANGATGYLAEVGHPLAAGMAGGVAIEVEDTSTALLDLGRAARRRLAGPTIGITGSVGKTSTKDFLAAALRTRWRVTANVQSFNNELGVPLTLANADADTEVTVVEMGARGVGHIALLCEVARPSVGIVTAVAPVHTEAFGSIEAVAEAKGELIEALPANGTAILNLDDERVAAMARRASGTVITYSANGRASANVAAMNVRVGDDLRATFELFTPSGRAPVTLAARGVHQVGNALAAAAAALRCDVPFADVVTALQTASVSHWRMEFHNAPSGAVVVNDAYNANPASMAAALQALASLPARRRLAVLGGMAELGDLEEPEHHRVAELARQLDIEVVAYGTDLYGAPRADDFDAAVAALGPLGEGDAVLVKASRVVELQRLVPRLLS